MQKKVLYKGEHSFISETMGNDNRGGFIQCGVKLKQSLKYKYRRNKTHSSPLDL
jgi:hypothetical protein